jgi:hypothetical protein
MRGLWVLKWLVVLLALSLLLAPAPALPAYSVHIEKSCPLMSGACKNSCPMSCSGKCSNSPDFKECTCQISLFSPIEATDSGHSYLGKAGSSSSDRQNDWTSSSRHINGDAYSSPPHANFDGIGPPDMDGIEYLPPSAKLVFDVLASDGPMTQKDLISKTGLHTNTVRYALGKLKEESAIRECFYFPDARQSLYRLNTASMYERK